MNNNQTTIDFNTLLTLVFAARAPTLRLEPFALINSELKAAFDTNSNSTKEVKFEQLNESEIQEYQVRGLIHHTNSDQWYRLFRYYAWEEWNRQHLLQKIQEQQVRLERLEKQARIKQNIIEATALCVRLYGQSYPTSEKARDFIQSVAWGMIPIAHSLRLTEETIEQLRQEAPIEFRQLFAVTNK